MSAWEKFIHLPYLVYFQISKRHAFLSPFSLVYQLGFLVVNKRFWSWKRFVKGASQRFMEGGEQPWQKNWQDPRGARGPQGSCCRLLSGKGLLDPGFCCLPVRLSFLGLSACILAESVCALSLELGELGSSRLACLRSPETPLLPRLDRVEG